MLFQSWLLTILVPLTLGAPVSREPSPPTLTIVDNMANATSPEKVAEIGNKIALGSKSRLQGSASTDGYSALGSGSSLSWGPRKMGLNHANKMHSYKNGVHNGGSDITSSDSGALGESSHGSGNSTASNETAIDSGGITIDTAVTGDHNEFGSATDTGRGSTTTGQQGTTHSTRTTSGSGSTISCTNTPSPRDRITSSTSKHK